MAKYPLVSLNYPDGASVTADDTISCRKDNMRYQFFSYDTDWLSAQKTQHQTALRTILTLNRGSQLDEDFDYRGSVFIGSEEAELLDLHWLAMLFCNPNNERLAIQLHSCQAEPIISARELISQILCIRTGHEYNPACMNSAQRNAWARAGKRLLSQQIPISMITLATDRVSSEINLRLFAPDKPDKVYNTIALHKWREAISTS